MVQEDNERRGGRAHGLVDVEIDSVKLAETDEVGSDQDLELTTLLFPLLTILGVTLVLHPDPELVHLNEVGQHKGN